MPCAWIAPLGNPGKPRKCNAVSTVPLGDPRTDRCDVASASGDLKGGAKVTLVTTEGSFSSGMPGGPATVMENYALLGAIIEHPEGNVFVKMTGPAPLVKDSRKKFLDFLATALAPK